MNELSIEEKAKAYDKIVDRAKKELNACGSQNCDAARQIFRLFPELAESDDERIRKDIIQHFAKGIEGSSFDEVREKYKIWIAWLEKQGEHANFRNKIQIGDKVTRNEDGILVNLSQLNRVAKKQGEQKGADKVEPKFKVGDWIVNDYCIGKVIALTDDAYLLDT